MHLLLASETAESIPSAFWVWPFVAILLAIAILPLLRKTHHWWEENRNKLLIAAVLAIITLGYYYSRPFGVKVHPKGEEAQPAAQVDEHAAQQPAHETPTTSPAEAEATPHDVAVETAVHGEAPTAEEAAAPPHDAHAGHGEMSAADEHADAAHGGGHAVHRSEPGMATVIAVLDHAVVKEYVPFIVLLFSLYVIAGGIVVRGDLRATPLTNTIMLAIGGALASFIGTTGAAMVLIRPVLKTNSERKYVVHTVVFFIFIVANIGGSLLPIGDPPLFLGYLRGVHFFWTFGLWKEWLFMLVLLLIVYFIWDTIAYRKEEKKDIARDASEIQPLRIAGLINVLWILGVVAAVATLDPAKPFPGTDWKPPFLMREIIQLVMAGVSLATTPKGLRKENQFNYAAIGEVACLFIGIFITMQVPIEILNAKGAELGLSEPWHFFWATGILSSFLDNAPTYVVFFETATGDGFTTIGRAIPVIPGRGEISEILLIAISCGAVFMGANSYIGNGPNFMVKSIAEQSGVKMPSFFGYMVYSVAILIPMFVILTLVFMHR